MMNILIIANFTRDFSTSDNGRFLYLAKELSKKHNVEIITTEFSHGAKTLKKPVTEKWPFKITMLKEPGYKRNISIKRFYSHHIWGKNLRDYLKAIKKPDVVYCAVPSLTGPNYAAKYCKENNIRFVIDIQDLWPEAFKMVVNVPVFSDLIFAPFKYLADMIYKTADSVCAVSQTYVDRALKVNKKLKSGTAVFLGTKLETFDSYSEKDPIMYKPDGDVWLAYCGTLGSSYDLISVFDAMDKLSKKNIRPKLIVMGDGPKRQEFEEYSSKKDIDVVFTGSLPYDEMCALLCECDITINPILGRSAASIINKHGDYAASGLPVVNTQESMEYRNLINEYQMGFNCRNADSGDIAEKVERLYTDEELRRKMGTNARLCAEERFDRRNSYNALIMEIVGGGYSIPSE
ncbi:MAG: glycosyltransferase family 4 protein [Eubacteriales bacterium]|nr:glycosyltransferase family 4 protein [Eubacteriales bacterium]